MHNRSRAPEKRRGSNCCDTTPDTQESMLKRACIFTKVKMHTFLSCQTYRVVSHKYFITLFSQLQYKNRPLYRYPPIAVNSTMIQVAGFLCLWCRALVPLLKSRFFVIYFRGVTLADGIGWCPPLVAIPYFLCYNTPNESEELVCT